MSNVFLVLLCGLPFGHFFFNKMDIWHGQGMFFQLGIMILLCCSLFKKSNLIHIQNKSLAVFTLWAGIVTSFYWYKIVSVHKYYPIQIFFPFFNFLCFVFFYRLSIEYLNKEKIEKILKWLSYSVLIVMGYCVLQKLNLDQFYMPLEGQKAPDELVGTIGNPSHLAGYFALCQPLYFKKGLINYLSLILLWLIIVAANSFSGFIVGLGILLFWLIFKKQFKIAILLSIIHFILGILMYFKNPQFFSFSHRMDLWKMLYENFKVKAITGNGMGIMNIWKLTPETSVWRHVHLEYFQVAVELGIIGFILILWCIWDYFNLFTAFRTDLTIRLSSIFFGFCLLGIFTFPAHLWLLASMGMLGYSFIYCLKNEVIDENKA